MPSSLIMDSQGLTLIVRPPLNRKKWYQRSNHNSLSLNQSLSLMNSISTFPHQRLPSNRSKISLTSARQTCDHSSSRSSPRQLLISSQNSTSTNRYPQQIQSSRSSLISTLALPSSRRCPFLTRRTCLTSSHLQCLRPSSKCQYSQKSRSSSPTPQVQYQCRTPCSYKCNIRCRCS